ENRRVCRHGCGVGAAGQLGRIPVRRLRAARPMRSPPGYGLRREGGADGSRWRETEEAGRADAMLTGRNQSNNDYAVSFSHLVMKLFRAAPLSGLPSEPTALGVQASFLHLVIDAVLAAPESGLPSALTALAAQLSGAGAGACATATPIANTETKAANAIRFMWLSLSS